MAMWKERRRKVEESRGKRQGESRSLRERGGDKQPLL